MRFQRERAAGSSEFVSMLGHLMPVFFAKFLDTPN